MDGDNIGIRVSTTFCGGDGPVATVYKREDVRLLQRKREGGALSCVDAQASVAKEEISM